MRQTGTFVKCCEADWDCCLHIDTVGLLQECSCQYFVSTGEQPTGGGLGVTAPCKESLCYEMSQRGLGLQQMISCMGAKLGLLYYGNSIG